MPKESARLWTSIVISANSSTEQRLSTKRRKEDREALRVQRHVLGHETLVPITTRRPIFCDEKTEVNQLHGTM